MKIQSNSIRAGINEIQQESNSTEAAKITKEVSPDAKNIQSAGQFATNIRSEQSFTAMMRASELQKNVSSLQTNSNLTEVMATVNASDGVNTLQELTQTLKSLNAERQDLMTQIKNLTGQLQGAMIAGNTKLVGELSAQLDGLKSQLGKVDAEIKEVMGEIEKLRHQEQQEQDRAKSAEERDSSIQKNLNKAADSYKSILDNLKL